MTISDAQIFETLGLSPDFDGAKIGYVNVLQAKGAMELIIDDHNETARENGGTIVLTFEEYRLALKQMEKLKRENAELAATEGLIATAKEDGLFDQYSAAVSRVAQNELYSGMDEKWADRSGQLGGYVASKVAGMSGASKADKQTISDVKSVIGDLHKMEADSNRKRLIQKIYYREPERAFARVFNPVVCTDDWEGYSNYLWHFARELMEDAAERELRARLTDADRQRHTYIVGGTGSGKSELIKTLVYDYTTQRQDCAVVVIDPHGDLSTQIAQWGDFRTWEPNAKRLAFLDPRLDDVSGQTFTINPLEVPSSASALDREVIAQQLAGAFEELLKGSAGAGLSVNMRAILMPCLLVLIDAGGKCLTDLQTFLNDAHNDQLVELGKQSPRKAVSRFFEREFRDKNFAITKQSLRTKLQSLFNSEIFYNIINGKTSFDLEQTINDKKVILFNLSKGLIGTDSSEALGRFVLALIQGMALRRQNTDRENRVPVHVFIDECQNYIGQSTLTILEEARKYGIHLTLAQQVAGRGMTPELRTVVLNNTAVKLVGRTAEDQRMAKLLGIELEDVQRLQVGYFYCRTGSHPTFMVEGDTMLLDDNGKMPEDEWQQTKAQQLAQYYHAHNAAQSTSSAVELL